MFLTIQLFSQNTLVGFGWGLTNFQNSIIENSVFSELEYNADSEYRYSFLLKYQIPGKDFRFKGGYNYSSIKGKGIIRDTDPEKTRSPLNVDAENELRTITLGLEYVVKDSLFSPYAGIDLSVSIFEDVDIYHQDKYEDRVKEIFPSKTKLGLSLNCGVGYTAIDGMELDLNLLYGSLNFLGKEDYENQIITIELTLSALFVF